MSLKYRTAKILSVVICLLAFSNAAEAVSMETSVKAMELIPQKLEITKEYIGYLGPLERVNIRSEASGTVERINFMKGQSVKKDQELVLISTGKLRLYVERARSNYDMAKVNYESQKALSAMEISLRKAELNLSQAKNDFNLADMEFNKEKKLMEKNFTTESNLDSKKDALETKRISLDRAKIELDQAKILTDKINLKTYQNVMELAKIELNLALLDMEKSKVKAPFSGIVKNKQVQVGGYVSAGESLLDIMDISKVLATINIPEKDMRYVNIGDQVTITLDAYPGQMFIGSLKTLGLEADTKSRSFPAEVVVDNKDRNLLPGMMARAVLTTVSKDGQIIIPSHAVVERIEGKYVFVSQNGKAIEKRVMLGNSAGDAVHVLKGLNAGDMLIVSGQRFLVQNQKINVIQSSRQYAVKAGN